MSRRLVDPTVQGCEHGDGVPQHRGGLLAPVAPRRSPGDPVRGPRLEAAALGTVHVGWRRGGHPLRHRAGRRDLPGQRRQSNVAKEDPRALNDVLPRGLSAVGHGTDSGRTCPIETRCATARDLLAFERKNKKKKNKSRFLE